MLVMQRQITAFSSIASTVRKRLSRLTNMLVTLLILFSVLNVVIMFDNHKLIAAMFIQSSSRINQIRIMEKMES